jgi:hypothetical protein
LAEHLARVSPSVTLDDPSTCLEWNGYVPVLVDGAQGGFEGDASPITYYWDITKEAVRDELVDDIAREAAKRDVHLPRWAERHVWIENRGYNVPDSIKDELREAIAARTSIPKANIEFIE